MSFVFGATSLTMYAPAKRSLRRSVHRSLAPGSVVGSDPLRAGRDPDAGVDFFLNDAAVGIPDFSGKAQPHRHSPQKTKKSGRSRIGRTVSHRQVADRTRPGSNVLCRISHGFPIVRLMI